MKIRRSKSRSLIHFDEAVKNKSMQMKAETVYVLEISIDSLGTEDRGQIINIIRQTGKVIPNFSSIIAPKITDNCTNVYIHDARRSIMDYNKLRDTDKTNVYKINNIIKNQQVNIFEINSSNDIIERMACNTAVFFVKFYISEKK
jgi:hypothetical protein